MLGIYGGTFDPIHFGHLRTALDVTEALGLTELRLLPCGRPPHRPQPLASANDRLAMLERALQDGDPRFAIDTRELVRPGPSYMVDTLQSIRTEIGARPLCLIVGMDAFCGLPGWHRWNDLFDLAHIVVMRRPDAPPPDTHPALQKPMTERLCAHPEQLKQRPAGRLLFVDVTQLAIAASDIRQRLANGRSPRYLLPQAVLDYIGREGIYGTPAG